MAFLLVLHYLSESYQLVSKMFSTGTVASKIHFALSKEAVLEHPKNIAVALLMLYLLVPVALLKLKFLSGVIVWWTTALCCSYYMLSCVC